MAPEDTLERASRTPGQTLVRSTRSNPLYPFMIYVVARPSAEKALGDRSGSAPPVITPTTFPTVGDISQKVARWKARVLTEGSG